MDSSIDDFGLTEPTGVDADAMFASGRLPAGKSDGEGGRMLPHL